MNPRLQNLVFSIIAIATVAAVLTKILMKPKAIEVAPTCPPVSGNPLGADVMAYIDAKLKARESNLDPSDIEGRLAKLEAAVASAQAMGVSSVAMTQKISDFEKLDADIRRTKKDLLEKTFMGEFKRIRNTMVYQCKPPAQRTAPKKS